MLNLPLVSFVVTSYNYEKYLLKTLESIKNQTYKNFEILIVDDASCDNSVKIAEKFIEENQDLKITLFVNETNQGQMAEMLKGLKESQGQFVSFIDSDDILMPDFAKIHIQTHLKTSVGMTSCAIIEIGEEDEVHTFNSISSPPCCSIEDLLNTEKNDYKIVKARFGGWHWSPNSSAMYRKAAIELLCYYKNAGKWRICPDKFIMNYAHLIGGSANINAPLVAYRRHASNAGNCTLVTGNKKLHSDKTSLVNLNNNIKIRPETIKFLWQEKSKLGLRNVIKLSLLCL